MAPSLLSDSPPPATLPGAKPTVYLLDNFHPDVMAFCEANFNTITSNKNPEKLAKWRENARYILVRGSWVTAKDIASAPHLLAIGKQGVGIDKIDATACKERDIAILNTPGANAQAVAEQVLTLTMAVARQVGGILSKQTQGILVPKEKCNGVGLHGKKIGIIGMGNIGRAVAKIFHGAFDAPIVGYDPFLPEDAWSEIPHKRVTNLEDIWAEADVVTVHMPLTPETRNLISYDQLKAMKNSAIVINAARGGIVNEQDLEKALTERLIWGAGLDCHEQEPPSQEKYGALWDLGVVSTPHIGAATSEAQVMTGMAAAKRLFEFIQNHESSTA